MRYTPAGLKAVLGPAGASLDFGLAPAIYLVAGLCADQKLKQRIVDEERKAAASGNFGGVLASGDANGCLLGRKVQAFVTLAQDVLSAFTPSPLLPVTVDSITKKCSVSVAYSGGTWLAMNRLVKYYPSTKMNTRVLVAPTPEEMESAMTRSGYDLSAPLGERLPFVAAEPEDPAIRVSMDSSNGFPVMGTMADEEARELCLQLATQLRRGLDAAADKDALVRHLRGSDERLAKPLLFLCNGKVKYDVYTIDKIRAQELRFYNVVPRPTLMVIQQAAQVVGASHKCVPLSNSTQGFALTGGGAAALVRYLDPDVSVEGPRLDIKYVHCGDDSWVVIGDSYTNSLHMLSADCSSFDLTQHRKVTEPVHQSFKGLLKKVDEGSAALWYSLMREREVTLYGSRVAVMRHAGPSGMALQSNVNDVLMEVFLSRFALIVNEQYGEAAGIERGQRVLEGIARRAMDRVAEELGLKVRVDDWVTVDGTVSLSAALAQSAFKYVGYWFYAVGPDADDVRVVCDFERMMAGLPYPSSSVYDEDKAVANLRIALKAVGVGISMGIPPLEWAAAWDKYTEGALRAIVGAEKQLDDSVWDGVASQVSALAGVTAERLKTLSGTGALADRLKRCLSEKFRYELWVGDRVASEDEEGDAPEPSNWADEVDEALKEYDLKLKAWQEERDRILSALRDAGLSEDSVQLKAPPAKPKRLAVRSATTWDNWGAPPTLQAPAAEKSRPITGWTAVLTRAEKQKGRKLDRTKRFGVIVPSADDYQSPSSSDDEDYVPPAGSQHARGRNTDWDNWGM